MLMDWWMDVTALLTKINQVTVTMVLKKRTKKPEGVFRIRFCLRL